MARPKAPTPKCFICLDTGFIVDKVVKDGKTYDFILSCTCAKGDAFSSFKKVDRKLKGHEIIAIKEDNKEYWGLQNESKGIE